MNEAIKHHAEEKEKRMALAWQHGAWVPFPGFLAPLPRDGID